MMMMMMMMTVNISNIYERDKGTKVKNTSKKSSKKNSNSKFFLSALFSILSF